MFLAHRVDALGRGGGIVGGLLDAAEEEPEPTLPVALEPNGRQVRKVLVSMAPEVGAQVQDWGLQHTALAEQQGDEQPPDPAVAVEERMDGLELRVDQPADDQEGEARVQTVSSMDVLLEGTDGLFHHLGRWWDEGSLRQGAPGRPDPVLGGSELPRVPLRTTPLAQQVGMDLAQQTAAYRQRGEALEPVGERGDVVDHLLHVHLGDVGYGVVQLEGEHIVEGALGPLDLGAEESLAPHVQIVRASGFG